MNRQRRAAREAALGVLYSWEVGGAPAGEAIEAFFAGHAPEAPAAVRAYAGELVHGTIAHLAEIDALIAAHARHWRIERLAILDRLILRMACWELRHGTGAPAAVVINEAVELARVFGADDSPRFVNGVLDGIRKALDEGPA